MIYDFAVIGGGASGLMAALRIAERAPSATVCVLERQVRVGRKLLATGNGRCNLLNTRARREDYHGSLAFIDEALRRYPPDRVLRVFEAIGLRAVFEADGRAYPASDQASSVLDVLRLTCAERGVALLTERDVRTIAPGFRIGCAGGETVAARRVVLCAGGRAAPKLGGTDAGTRLLQSLGHEIAPCRPALTQLQTPPALVRPLKGIRCRCDIALTDGKDDLRRESGEVLFTEYGLSGIAAMQLSRIAARRLAQRAPVSVRLALDPRTPAEVARALGAWRDQCPARALEDALSGLLPKRLGQILLKQTGLTPLTRPFSDADDRALSAVAALICGWTLPVTGTMGFEGAQVTAGGATDRDIEPRTLMSRRIPGLYVAGETLDIDGDCGGFNLYWAWASALLAADAAVTSP